MITPEQLFDDLSFGTHKPSLSDIAAIQADAREGMVSKEELELYRTTLHDIFEMASRQKSNRDSACPEGLVDTAKAAVRVIRRVCDERNEGMVPAAELRPTIELLKHWPASHTAAHNELARLETLSWARREINENI